MSVDKKAQGGRLRFILLERLGSAVIRGDVAPDALRATLGNRRNRLIPRADQGLRASFAALR